MKKKSSGSNSSFSITSHSSRGSESEHDDGIYSGEERVCGGGCIEES
jgi:hypothetical protein